MKIVSKTILLNSGGYLEHVECRAALAEIEDSIREMVWPPESDRFTIFAQSGKRSGQGSGVGPIRAMFISRLVTRGWTPEVRFPVADEQVPGGAKFGAMDAAKSFGDGPPFMVEWETGNISSSHRALNKMALGIMRGLVSGGVLIVPTRDLATFLTDRIGNLRELVPYFDLWSAIPVRHGYLGIIAVEHDEASIDVPAFRKGTDGRSRG